MRDHKSPSSIEMNTKNRLIHYFICFFFLICKAEPNKKLYVGNIAYETTKEELIDFFSQYGNVRDVYIPLDRESNLPRGFAFITMNQEDADNAIENASGVELMGRTIDVKESLPRGQRVAPREKRSGPRKYLK